MAGSRNFVATDKVPPCWEGRRKGHERLVASPAAIDWVLRASGNGMGALPGPELGTSVSTATVV